MTDRELKKSLKKLKKCVILSVLIIFLLGVYILSSSKAPLSVYENTEYANSAETFGIDKEELEKYLSIFGVVLNSEENETVKTLDVVTRFIDDMSLEYDEETKTITNTYDVELINQIAKEIKGTYLNKKQKLNDKYTYNQEEKKYIKNKQEEKESYCLKIDEIAQNDDVIEIVYELAYMTPKQMVDYMTEKKDTIKTKKVKVEIMKNDEYEYSKYFLESIEEI